MLHHHHHMNQSADYEPAGRRVSPRDSSKFSDARDTHVTIAIIEPTKSEGKTSIQVWLWRAVCLLLVLTMGVGLWKIATHKSKKEMGGAVYDLKEEGSPIMMGSPLPDSSDSPEDPAEKVARAAEVATWNVSDMRLTAATWEDQVERIRKDFKARYPEKYRLLPFDVNEHYRWKVKHNVKFDAMDTEEELYSMLYYDWSSHKEEEPLLKLLDGGAISRRREWAEKRKDFSYSMDHVLVDGKRVERKPFPGSRTETRPLPQDIIDGFKATDETTKVANSIFEKWEGYNWYAGGPRLCAEDCALRLGLLVKSGSYLAVMREGHELFRTCPIIERANHAFLDELLRNDAFRNYLAWKGLRKISTEGWGTLIYNHINSKPYEMLLFVSDKYTEGFLTADGDAWYSSSWNYQTAYRSNEESDQSFPSSAKHLTDSLVLRSFWPLIKFPGSSV